MLWLSLIHIYNLHTVEADDEAGTITVDGKTLKIYAMAKAAELPWGEIGVDVVLECTGFYCSKEKAQAHIDAGAKKVVISAPAGNDLPTIVYSVNEKTLTAEDTIISAASCTTNCLDVYKRQGENNIRGVEIFLHTLHAARTRNRNDPRFLVQHPGQRDLCGCGVFLLGS